MGGIEGTPILASDYYGVTAPTLDLSATPTPTYEADVFGPSYFAGNSDAFFRSISGAPAAPYVPGVSDPVAPTWSVGGDMSTMTIDGTLSGGSSILPVAGMAGSGIGAARIDESMGSRMQTAILLPGGGLDWGKVVMVVAVIVTLYAIGREMGRKGSVQ